MHKVIKKKSLSSLEKTLDRWFSKFIRLRDSYWDGRALIANCATCGNFVVVWTREKGYNPRAHNGHFIGRRYKATRYDEKNCNVQDVPCNHYGEGKQFEHGDYIDRKYGAGTAKDLLIKSKMVCKRTRYDYEVLIDHYKSEVKRLEKERGIR